MTLDQKIELLNFYLKHKDHCFYHYLNSISFDIYFNLEMLCTSNEIYLYLNNLANNYEYKELYNHNYITLNQKLLIFDSILHDDEYGFFEFCVTNSKNINSKMKLDQDLSDIYSLFLELKQIYNKL